MPSTANVPELIEQIHALHRCRQQELLDRGRGLTESEVRQAESRQTSYQRSAIGIYEQYCQQYYQSRRSELEGIWNVRHTDPFLGPWPRLQRGETRWSAADAAAASRGEVQASRNYVDHAAGPAWNGQVIWSGEEFTTTDEAMCLGTEGSTQSRGCLCEDHDDSL
jgi:hypothetical protein